MSGTVNKRVLKILKSKETAFVKSNEDLYEFFRAVDNSLIEYEEEELNLSQRGILSDHLNEDMTGERNFRFKRDAGKRTYQKYEDESQNLMDNEWREEKDIGTKRKHKKKKIPQKNRKVVAESES